MNLQEILSYRERCLHCARPLVMRIKEYPKLSITQNDGGLAIRSGHKDGVRLSFGFDGKYERNKRNYKIHAGPVHIQKRCQFHPLRGMHVTTPSNGKIIKLKSRSVGATTMTNFGTTLDSLRDTTCQYGFTLFGDSQGNYDVNLTTDFVYWHDDKEFWHVNTYFATGFTQVYHSTYGNTMEDLLRNRLEIPAINLKSVTNAEQLLQKLKLYTLFS
jgi:hypothetical protein